MSEAAQALDNPGTPDAQQSQPAAQPAEQPTIANGGGLDAPAVPQTWPDDWRTKIAGDDEKELKRLERMNSPQDIYKAYRNMESEFSKRQPKLEYAPDMPEEKLAEWRNQEGIPETPDGYNLEFDDGLVIGENDRATIADFTKFAHENNLPESAVKAAIRYDLERVANAEKEWQQKNHDFQVENLAQLKTEWGPEYQGNLNAINELFTDHPEIKDVLFEATDSEGLQIGNNASLVRWAVDVAKKLNPTATLVFPGGEGGMKGAESRLAELKAQMGTEQWYKNPALGKEYEDLLTRLDAAKPRG
jgi:hypothetical protein